MEATSMNEVFRRFARCNVLEYGAVKKRRSARRAELLISFAKNAAFLYSRRVQRWPSRSNISDGRTLSIKAKGNL